MFRTTTTHCKLLQRFFRGKREISLVPSCALVLQKRTTVSQFLTPSTAFRSHQSYCSNYTHGERPITDTNEHPPQIGEAETSEFESYQGEGDTFNIDVLVALLRQENAQDICVIRVPPEMKYTEYFVVVSGTSTRHLRAMAFYAVKVYKFMRGRHEPHVNLEGKDAEDWMCIDFGNMVVHFMLPETRETYELEKLWTLRHYDNQLCSIPPEILPEDFIYGTEVPK